ncbi:DUF2254 domain-containing protein [Pseudomonas putida]|uniref:DUF2254 domain-containing protein n=1 Tax=Pseudomonas putida TaxID=303 RepID=UPI0023635FCB|nr:DUF2254 domain-containing protein [Pseudomonas putida]MDD1963831.1 DUF2254 domain-containing protein [Pseudomonas putida]
MTARWHWLAIRLTKRLWFRASLFSVLGVATALLAVVFDGSIPPSLSTRIGADAVDNILSIIASSMLAVTTFSLSTMVSAYSAASSGVTPRATTLVMEDTTTQNALATFIGSFLFSLVGIIALSTGVYGAEGRAFLFAVTIVVIILIVYTLLRWIDHLSRLGRVGETIDRVESAALEALNHRVEWPYLGGSAYPAPLAIPTDLDFVPSEDTGYIQHIDVQALGAIATAHQLRIYVEVLPGSFVHMGMHLAKIDGLPPEADAHADIKGRILQTLTIGIRRTFEHDPRFGLSVLSEIASRALSPAVNDPGTAIDVIGRGIRIMTCWGQMHVRSTSEVMPGCERIFLKSLRIYDLFDDFFGPISRDGAALMEVNIRLLKALRSLTQINPALFGDVCAVHAANLVKRSDVKLTLQYEKDQLVSLANMIKP